MRHESQKGWVGGGGSQLQLRIISENTAEVTTANNTVELHPYDCPSQ